MARASHRSTVRRFESAEIDPAASVALSASHPALREGRTIFPSSVVSPMASPRFLVSGHNSPKLGREVLKGERTGWPIFQLSLEERATCPRTCEVWDSCYGNAMPFARRHDHRSAYFLPLLTAEAQTLCRANPGGLLIRLHVLGDFYSVEYVMAWAQLLADFPQLHVFGYTARKTTDPEPESARIALAIKLLTDSRWNRFAIRTSGTSDARSRSIVVDTDPGEPDVIVCPAQTKLTEACATCGLCWAEAARDKTIAFLRHGMKPHRGPRDLAAVKTRPPLPRPAAERHAKAAATTLTQAKPRAPALGPLGDGRTLRQIQTERLRATLVRLADATGALTISLADLGRESGIPGGSTLPVVRDLIDAGELTRQKNTSPGSRAPAPSTYRLTSQAAEPVPVPEPIDDDPSMSPGGPHPDCERAAIAADEAPRPDVTAETGWTAARIAEAERLYLEGAAMTAGLGFRLATGAVRLKPSAVRVVAPVVPPRPFKPRLIPETNGEPRVLTALAAGMCRYPINDPAPCEEFMFCATGTDAVYCAAHATVCFSGRQRASKTTVKHA